MVVVFGAMMVVAAHVPDDDAAVVLVVARARRVVVGEGGRDCGGEKGRARSGDQKTVHSLVPYGSMVA
jgi:hypothetical protein